MPPHPLVFLYKSSQVEFYHFQLNAGASPIVVMDIGAFESQVYPVCVVYAFSMFKVDVGVPLVTVEVEKIFPGEALVLLRLVESLVTRYYCRILKRSDSAEMRQLLTDDPGNCKHC